MKPLGPRGNILIIDDDDEMNRLLRYSLKNEGFKVFVYDHVSDIDREELSHMRMVIANAMTHDITGMDLLIEMKSNPSTENIPFILCCVPESEELLLTAFDIGVDDFVKKPYSLREMLARINAVLNRYPYEIPLREETVIDGINVHHLDLHIDTTNRTVEHMGNVIPLTKTEYSIFVFLIKNINNFYTRDQIFSEIWKDDSSVNVRIVDTNISRLRKKLGDASKNLVNRYGSGYAILDR